MAEEEQVVGHVHVGQSKIKMLSAKHTVYFHFHDVENLKQQRGKKIASASHPCHGSMWAIHLYPFGHKDSSKDEDYFSIFLKRCSGTENSVVDAEYSLRTGQTEHYDERHTFPLDHSWGWHNFVKRADVLDPSKGYLRNGTLTVKADIQVYLNKPEIWAPSGGTLKCNLMNMFKSEEFADVTFVIGGKTFRAHRLILAVSSPILAEMAEGVPKDAAIQIDNVEPSIFYACLHSLYSDELPKDFDIGASDNAKALLDVADKFQCTNLKLLVEAELAASSVTVENVIDLLLYADSKNCALLKEVALHFFVAHCEAVMDSEGYSLLDQSPKILKELVRALAKPKIFDKDDTNIDGMSVGTLRRKLNEAGLDVDGTREMLVERLKECSVDKS